LETPHWPIDPLGTLIGTQQGGTDPQTARYGIDFTAVTFSGAAFRSIGFEVGPAGNTLLNNFTASGSSTVGNGAGAVYLHVNGGGSGANNGPAISLDFGGGGRGGIGAYSAMIGGAYDSRIVVSGYDGLVFAVAGTSRMAITSSGMGFNGTAPIAKPTGVAVTIAAVHAALVSYGLIAP